MDVRAHDSSCKTHAPLPIVGLILWLLRVSGTKFWQFPLPSACVFLLMLIFPVFALFLFPAAVLLSFAFPLAQVGTNDKLADPIHLDTWFANFEQSKQILALQIETSGGMCGLLWYWALAMLRDISRMGTSWLYGEIDATGIQTVLRHAMVWRRRHGRPAIRCFLDLGGGHGKAVLFAAALFPWLECAVAVELSETRHRAAIRNRRQLNGRLQKGQIIKRVGLMHGDLLCAVAAVAAADVIWVHNTCFHSLNRQISALIAEHAQEGTLVYSVTQLPSSGRLLYPEIPPLRPAVVGLSYWPRQRLFCAEVVGLPRSGVGAGETQAQQAEDRIFARWAPVGFLREKDHLRAAVESVLLGSLPADRILEEFSVKDGLGEICSHAFAGNCGDLDFAAFERLCRKCRLLFEETRAET